MNLAAVLAIWKDHGTKLLGASTTLIPALLAIEGLIPDGQRKWWLMAAAIVGALTVNRGFTNSKELQK